MPHQTIFVASYIKLSSGVRIMTDFNSLRKMKRSLSASLLEVNNSSKVLKSSYTFDYVSESINNRLSDQ